jgi:hypothetical protein
MPKIRENLPLLVLVLILLVVAITLVVLLVSGGRNAPAQGTVTAVSSTPEAAAAETQTFEALPTSTTAPPTETSTLETPLATGTATPTNVPTRAPTADLCDRAAFVEDVTIPDGTEIEAGSKFTKTWRLQNDGSCTWTSDYEVVFSSGDQLGGPDSKQLTQGSVAPGDTVKISVDLKAPSETGTYQGYWLLANASGQPFGIYPGNSPFWVDIEVVEKSEATEGPTRTATPTATGAPGATATATATATQGATNTPTATETAE